MKKRKLLLIAIAALATFAISCTTSPGSGGGGGNVSYIELDPSTCAPAQLGGTIVIGTSVTYGSQPPGNSPISWVDLPPVSGSVTNLSVQGMSLGAGQPLAIAASAYQANDCITDVVVMMGLNDAEAAYKNCGPPQWICPNTMIPAQNAAAGFIATFDPVGVNVHFLGETYVEATRENAALINNWMSQFAAFLALEYGAPDIGAALGNPMPAGYTWDGTHPTAATQALIAAEVHPHLP